MKKLLVPTDFSDNALHAVQYAISLANAIHADVHLLHTFQLASSGAGHFANIDGMVERDRKEQLDALVRKVKPLLKEELRLEAKVLHGYAVDTIVEQAKAVHADYVVMGTRGATGLKKMFMGSTTSNVVRGTNVPVIAVPEQAGDFNIKQILFALDDRKMDPALLLPGLSIAQKTGAEVNLLYLSQTDDTDIDADTRDYLKKMDIGYKYYKLQTQGDIEDNILQFAQDKQIDLLCVLNRHRSWFAQVFATSVSQQLAMESTIPLLVIDAAG